MHLDECLHVEGAAQFDQLRQLILFQGCDDQQESVRSGHSGFVDLVGVEEKILALLRTARPCRSWVRQNPGGSIPGWGIDA